LPEPGRTITLGPEGMLTHALKENMETEHTASRAGSLGIVYIVMMILLLTGRLRRHLQPALGAFLDIRIIAVWISAIIPIISGLWRLRLHILALDIHRRCGRDGCRRITIVRIITAAPAPTIIGTAPTPAVTSIITETVTQT
jgi:hypothetical protein